MQNVLKFLLEIDNKLEEMLTFLRSEEDTSDLFSVKAVDVSGGGLSFFSKETYPEETLLYIMGAIRESFYKVDFAAIGKIVSKENTPEGFIYGVHFVTIDEDIREDIIKFVFEREREMIKEVKETV
jgi:c-di-GMP-binding flagellar brake protein YcgR